jgi:O-acetyl-ADP-ribose deacetylase
VQITVVRGDITEQTVDAIVNAANSSLLGGGGVDGAIHRRGGPAILAACRELRATRYPDGLPTGQAAATTAGDLPARWVIHTVGPIYDAVDDPAGLLASCHREAIRVAVELGASTVAFPAISCGVYGYPVAEAAPIAVAAVRAAVRAAVEAAVEAVENAVSAGGEAAMSLEEVRFVLFDERTRASFADALTHADAPRTTGSAPAR